MKCDIIFRFNAKRENPFRLQWNISVKWFQPYTTPFKIWLEFHWRGGEKNLTQLRRSYDPICLKNIRNWMYFPNTIRLWLLISISATNTTICQKHPRYAVLSDKMSGHTLHLGPYFHTRLNTRIQASICYLNCYMVWCTSISYKIIGYKMCTFKNKITF